MTPQQPAPTSAARPSLPELDGSPVRWIPVDRIEPDENQPRKGYVFESLDRLAGSLRTHGQLQPIVLRPAKAPGRYVIVLGERRWRATQLAGLPAIAAVVLESVPDQSQILEMQVLENAMREDLSPLDQARAYRALMEQNGWTASRVAAAVHVYPSTVTRALSLLDLPGEVQPAVEAGTLTPTAAAQIATVDDPDRQRALATRATEERLNRKAVRDASRHERQEVPPQFRHRFKTSVGRVSVTLDPLVDASFRHRALLTALVEASKALMNEPRANV